MVARNQPRRNRSRLGVPRVLESARGNGLNWHDPLRRGFRDCDRRGFGFCSRKPKFSGRPPVDFEAGECTKHVGSDTLNGAKHAGEGIVTALRDTKITAKVKAALLVDKLTGNSHIYVNTLSGVVTLSGSVLSPWVAARAEQLAKQTEGVRGVVNNLKLSGTEVSRCAQSPQSPAAKR
jgi:BON domain